MLNPPIDRRRLKRWLMDRPPFLPGPTNIEDRDRRGIDRLTKQSHSTLIVAPMVWKRLCGTYHTMRRQRGSQPLLPNCITQIELLNRLVNPDVSPSSS
jgi:hypothetical protein